MTRLRWLGLAFIEITAALIIGWAGVVNIIRILIFSKPKDFFGPDSTYFLRKLTEDLVRIASAAILIAHSTWIARRRVSKLSF